MSEPIPDDHLQATCKMGQGADCCRYLMLGSKGFQCCKHEPGMKSYIDGRVHEGTMHATGDNCEGWKP